MYFFFILRLFFLLRLICFWFFLSIDFFSFVCAVHWISHHIPIQVTSQTQKSLYFFCSINQWTMKNMEVPHRWELHLAHFELDHPLGFSLNPLWKVWVLLAPQVLAELSHTVGARNPKPKNQYNQSMNNEKYGSTATLRATLGTLRAGSPFRVLPQPSLEGMSALSTPSVSRTQPYGWGPKSQTQKSI